MKETRHHDRVRTILGAQIIFNNKNSTLECQIRNISSAGAKLAVSETVSLPNEFELHVPHKGRSFRARLRWRTVDAVGVEFLRDEASGAPAASENLTGRLNELESENELLRKRVLELMVELEKAGGARVKAVA